MTGPRLAALITLLVLGAALVAVVAVTTPWQPLSGSGARAAVDPARDFTAAEQAREDAFHRAVRPPAYAAIVLSLVVALALGLTPLGARLIEAVARPLGGGWLWQLVLGGIALVVVGQVVTLPLRAWQESVMREYGLSSRDWSGWAVDTAKGFGISLVLLLIVLIGLYSLARWFPRMWWAPAAVLGAGLVLVLTFLFPLLVEPVFNKFTPMPEGPLRTSLLALAETDGVPVSEVLVADASRRTTALNAYVSGYGSTRRIVVYDTALEGLPERELKVVVAHELGHAKRNDVLHGAALGALGAAAGTCLIYLLVSWGPLLRRAGIERFADPRSMALLLAVIAVIGVVTGPGQLLVSRRIEARADVHALDLTRDPRVLAAMHRRLAVTNLSDLDPHPLIYVLFASHPTGPERIALARDWAARHGLESPAALAAE